MPSDSNGVYSLPPGYLATDGNTIQASQHNPPLEDIASALSSRLPRNGNAPMTGPLKVPDGTAGAPSLTFASAPTVGFFKTTNGFGVSVNGVQVFEFTAAPKGRLVGEIVDWTSGVPPAGWLACQGQSLSTTTYAELFALFNYTYGGAGANFNIPDLRCCVTVGYDTTRGILSGATGFGVLLGQQSQTIAQGNLPALTLPDTLGISRSGSVALSAAAGSVVNGAGVGGGANMTGGGGALNSGAITVVDTQAWSKTGSVTTGGSGTPLSVVQPTFTLNKIIFTGVV